MSAESSRAPAPFRVPVTPDDIRKYADDLSRRAVAVSQTRYAETHRVDMTMEEKTWLAGVVARSADAIAALEYAADGLRDAVNLACVYDDHDWAETLGRKEKQTRGAITKTTGE